MPLKNSSIKLNRYKFIPKQFIIYDVYLYAYMAIVYTYISNNLYDSRNKKII